MWKAGSGGTRAPAHCLLQRVLGQTSNNHHKENMFTSELHRVCSARQLLLCPHLRSKQRRRAGTHRILPGTAKSLQAHGPCAPRQARSSCVLARRLPSFCTDACLLSAVSLPITGQSSSPTLTHNPTHSRNCPRLPAHPACRWPPLLT